MNEDEISLEKMLSEALESDYDEIEKKKERELSELKFASGLASRHSAKIWECLGKDVSRYDLAKTIKDILSCVKDMNERYSAEDNILCFGTNKDEKDLRFRLGWVDFKSNHCCGASGYDMCLTPDGREIIEEYRKLKK